MKKFKTRNYNCKIKILVIIVVSLVLFILISFYQLKDNHQDLTIKLLNNFGNESSFNLRFLTSNLDNLLNN